MREGKKYEFRMNIQDKFTRAYETIIDVKYLDFGSESTIHDLFDHGSAIRDGKILIRDPA